MSQEQEIVDKLYARFPSMKDKAVITRPRRIFADAPVAEFPDIFQYAVKELDFSMLCTITGLDLGTALAAEYHLARTDGIMLNITVSLDRQNPVLQTVTANFPAADAYEREMVDLLGIQVAGLGQGHRYPLPEGWPEGVYPLRKDCDLSKLPPPKKEQKP